MESVKQYQLGTDQVIYIPTGDGICIALLNIGSPFDLQIKIALKILECIHNYNSRISEENLKFQVRIGINAGRDNVITDINGRRNVSGNGVNMASRIMDKADGGNVLIGEIVYDNLKNHDEYASAFKQHPSILVKHGILLNIYQFVRDDCDFLNVDRPSAFFTPIDAVMRKQEPASASRNLLRLEGFTIRVQLGPSDAEQRWAKSVNVTLPKALCVMALIDTGASATIINPQVAVTCGLLQTDSVRISSVGQILQVPVYAGAISFPDSDLKNIDPARLIACPLPAQQHFSCILGRDVLERWKVTYNGRQGSTVIED